MLPCKIGTYNPTAASSGDSACISCSEGKYCDEEGLDYEKGQCDAGYFCRVGSPSRRPAINVTLPANALYLNLYGLCPRGHYCIAGTSEP